MEDHPPGGENAPSGVGLFFKVEKWKFCSGRGGGIAIPGLNESKISDGELPLLNRIIAHLSANFHRRVTLDELSRELHVSGSTIRQTFRKKMNVSIGHYQLVQRLRHGIRLLQSTSLSVAEVAEKVGFSSANGFMLAVKRECKGATPKKFRKSGEN